MKAYAFSTEFLFCDWDEINFWVIESIAQIFLTSIKWYIKSLPVTHLIGLYHNFLNFEIINIQYLNNCETKLPLESYKQSKKQITILSDWHRHTNNISVKSSFISSTFIMLITFLLKIFLTSINAVWNIDSVVFYFAI